MRLHTLTASNKSVKPYFLSKVIFLINPLLFTRSNYQNFLIFLNSYLLISNLPHFVCSFLITAGQYLSVNGNFSFSLQVVQLREAEEKSPEKDCGEDEDKTEGDSTGENVVYFIGDSHACTPAWRSIDIKVRQGYCTHSYLIPLVLESIKRGFVFQSCFVNVDFFSLVESIQLACKRDLILMSFIEFSNRSN